VYTPGLAPNVKNFDEVLVLSKHSHHIAARDIPVVEGGAEILTRDRRFAVGTVGVSHGHILSSQCEVHVDIK